MSLLPCNSDSNSNKKCPCNCSGCDNSAGLSTDNLIISESKRAGVNVVNAKIMPSKTENYQFSIARSKSEDLLVGRYRLFFDLSYLQTDQRYGVIAALYTQLYNPVNVFSKQFIIQKIDTEQNSVLILEIEITKNPFGVDDLVMAIAVLAGLAGLYLILTKIEKIIDVGMPFWIIISISALLIIIMKYKKTFKLKT